MVDNNDRYEYQTYNDAVPAEQSKLKLISRREFCAEEIRTLAFEYGVDLLAETIVGDPALDADHLSTIYDLMERMTKAKPLLTWQPDPVHCITREAMDYCLDLGMVPELRHVLTTIYREFNPVVPPKVSLIECARKDVCVDILVTLPLPIPPAVRLDEQVARMEEMLQRSRFRLFYRFKGSCFGG